MSSHSQNSLLTPPYGGRLVDLTVPAAERDELIREAGGLPGIQLSPRALADLELLATGALSPLDRFMGKADYNRVVAEMRLANGTLFPMPVTLPVANAAALDGKEVALRNTKNELVAILRVEEIFESDPLQEAEIITGTSDRRHPLVAEMYSWGRFRLSGALTVLMLPRHHDFRSIRGTPAEVRAELARFGTRDIIAFQPAEAIDRATEEFLKSAVDERAGALLLNPAAGMPKPGDIDHYTRIRAWLALYEKYLDRSRTALNLMPLAPRLAGPREAIWHAIIQRNYGARHIVIAREYADPGREAKGERFYGPGEAAEAVARYAGETGVWAVPVALPTSGKRGPDISFRPEVAEVLSQAHPPRRQQGFCIWFTGLPSAGKSTIAEILAVKLLEHGRQVTVLDGDVVRTHLSKGLGFSKEDRDANILRIGFVAAEITRHHGAVICAAVSPYEATREQVRRMVGADRFVLVWVATPVQVCEQRDVKRMYARAKAGEIQGFTGVDDPYEPPQSPDIRLTTTDGTAEECATRILQHLAAKGFLAAPSAAGELV